METVIPAPLSLQAYLSDPCGTSSIPYWKQKTLSPPPNMRIVHERDYSADAFPDYTDEPYFRLYHDLKSIAQPNINEAVTISVSSDTDAFMRLINASYIDLRVTREQLDGYRKTLVYRPDLWILLKDKATGAVLAGGIADYDSEVGELILEWIQVLPEHRGRGYGQIIVNTLLSKMQSTAKFATVSGKADNPTNPERLYRKCGFAGDDVWHVLTKG